MVLFLWKAFFVWTGSLNRELGGNERGLKVVDGKASFLWSELYFIIVVRVACVL